MLARLSTWSTNTCGTQIFTELDEDDSGGLTRDEVRASITYLRVSIAKSSKLLSAFPPMAVPLKVLCKNGAGKRAFLPASKETSE